ncbi:MAG: HEPN domain-containing protein [Spirochaetes bacterium]|nr:HEPN domain-containing protein [Spirochaetota bacterium]
MPLTPQERNTIVKYRLKRSEETWKEAKFLFENNMLAASVNRIYYSMFYAVNALAIENGFQTGKHTRLIGWFNKKHKELTF